jgi:chemotaxis protein methyltransferase CheR
MLTDLQFARLRQQADRLAGIALLDRHRATIARRMPRLGLASDGIAALLDAVEACDPSAAQRLISLLTTNHTTFFRHPHQLDLAAEQALWAVHRRGSAAIWSAAASTGQEPWSLAMAVLGVFGRDDPPVTILASDIDAAALAVAEAGSYDAAAIAAIPAEHRSRGVSDGRITPVVRALVRFARLNLIDVAWPFSGPFDVVCCRNVLMYLGQDHRYAILERIAALLAPDGMLLLDPSEHLGTAGSLFTAGGGGVYSLRSGQRPQRMKSVRKPS